MPVERVTRLALVTVALASALFVGKLAAAFASGSIGLLSTAIDSGLDLVLSVTVLLGVHLARRPADPEHPYGHGKFENVAGLLEAGVLAATGVIVGFFAVRRIVDPLPVQADLWIVGVMLVAVVVSIERTLTLSRAAREHRSPAFAVDAWHFGSDLVTTLLALGGLALATRGAPWADGASALLIAVVLTVGSVHAAWKAVGGLVDRAEPETTRRVREAISRVPNVQGTPQVRMRGAGGDVFVDATVQVPRALGMERAHAVMDQVEAAVRGVVGRADVVVHAEPVSGAEDVATTLKVVASREARILGIHEIYVDRVEREGEREGAAVGFVVDCHVEVDASLSVADAHRAAQDFETAAKAAVPQVVGMRTHIEPAVTGPRLARDVTREHDDMVERIERALSHRPFVGGGSVVLKLVEGHLEAVVTARLPADIPFQEAHKAAEELERRVLAMMPALARVVVHVEPAA